MSIYYLRGISTRDASLFGLPAAQDAVPEARGIQNQQGSLGSRTAPRGSWLVSHSPGLSAALSLFQAPESAQ